MVDLTYDKKVTYSSAPVPIELIPPPIILSLNNTAYFYTHHEQVWIALTGKHLDKGMHLYVRIQD